MLGTIVQINQHHHSTHYHDRWARTSAWKPYKIRQDKVHAQGRTGGGGRPAGSSPWSFASSSATLRLISAIRASASASVSWSGRCISGCTTSAHNHNNVPLTIETP